MINNYPLNKKPHELVMLIDDSFIDNFVNKKVISRYGFADEVIEFAKAKDALEFLDNLKNDSEAIIPAFLFLDLEMPEINGFEFLDAFELLSDKVKENLNIVVLTSMVNPSHIQVCRKYKSVLTFLHKPLMKGNLDAMDKMLSEKKFKLVKY
jgi:CheY-like chemotaxis protein